MVSFPQYIINLQRYEKKNKTLMKYLKDKKFDQNLVEGRMKSMKLQLNIFSKY